MTINNVRIDSFIREIFIRLHEWTNGHIWQNLVFVFGRTERSLNKQSERFAELKSITKGMKSDYLNTLIAFHDSYTICRFLILKIYVFHFERA